MSENTPYRPSLPGMRPRWQSVLAGALLGFGMVLLLRRYWGIDHDSALYLGQGLVRLWPEIFGSDLFFAHGSQGSYTLFPWLTALAMGWVDPPTLFKFGGLAGLLCFAAAGWYCLRALLPETQRYWAWLGALCLPTIYGRTAIFSYSEPFLTPRPFAEALALLGLGLLSRRRWWPAAACAIVAASLHPLQTLAALLIVWPWLVMQDRRWLHAAWLAIPVALLGLSGVPPFDAMYRPFAQEWLPDLREFNGQLFVSDWPASDYKVLAFDVFVLVLAWRSVRGPFGAWCAAALAGLALGFTASLALVDGLHLQLPAALQLWRTHWLAHWFSMAAIGALLYRDVARRDALRALLLGLNVLLVGYASPWLWIPFAILYACWSPLSGRLQPRLRLLIGGLFVLIMLAMLGNHLVNEFASFRQSQYRLDLYAFDRQVLAFPLLAFGLPLLGVYAWKQAGSRERSLLLAAVLCPIVVLAALRWDIRTPTVHALEDNAFRSDLFGVEIPPGAEVFWDGVGLVGPWLTLRRADYFSPQQLSGVIFNRGTSIDARQRLGRIELLARQSLYCRNYARTGDNRRRCLVGDDAMRRACEPGPVRPPDYIVLPLAQTWRSAGSWNVTDPITGRPRATYHLYRCADFMEDMEYGARARTGSRTDLVAPLPTRVSWDRGSKVVGVKSKS